MSIDVWDGNKRTNEDCHKKLILFKLKSFEREKWMHFFLFVEAAMDEATAECSLSLTLDTIMGFCSHSNFDSR